MTSTPKSVSPQTLVAQFHEIYEMPNRVKEGGQPSLDTDRLEMRMSLIKEEFAELCGAVYGPDAQKQVIESCENLPDQHERDIVETADALADLTYVIYGMALECGIDLDAVLAEVHRSNRSKLMPDGSVKRRSDGKILKGPNFTPPDIAGTLYCENNDGFDPSR